MRRKWLPPLLILTVLVVLLGVVPASAAPNQGSITHVVQRGETLYSIARRYNVDVWTLARANGVANPNRIYVGQCLVIPTKQTTTGAVHIVRPGETLSGIAWHYGINLWALARANGIANINHIYVGQRLVIPGTQPSAPTKKPSTSLPSSFPGPWTGEYFDNVALSGSAYATRTDENINFNWAYGPPAGGMPTNNFSVRWSGTFHFDEGTYRFYAKVDDGVRVYVDDELIINGWRDGGLRLYTKDKALTAGEHNVRVEYYDRVEVARIYTWWRKISGPKPTPEPSTTPAPSVEWSGEFYNNDDLSGDPVAKTRHPYIGFDWGVGSPMPEVQSDHFSARWTTRMHLKTDHYRFCAMTDDGVRIWVGKELVVDKWFPNNGIAYCGAYWAQSGNYDVKVEYYEDGGDALIYVWWEPH